MNPKRWLRDRFSEYYEREGVSPPPRIWEREFGVGIEKKIDYRHLSFKDEKELNAYLKINTPLFISYSAAYYQYPGATPMESKKLIGADLIFDFDLGDITSDCDGKFPSPECLDLVKREVIKLIEDFLIPDFGFSRDEILVFFSGSKGYHVHIRSDIVQDLDQRARMELVDYVSGVMNPRYFIRVVGKSIRGPRPDQGGWHGKLARALINVLNSEDVLSARKKLGIGLSTCKKLMDRKEMVIDGIRRGIWDQAPVGKETWNAILSSLVTELGVKLDRNVTIDMARLIRLPTSLHGDSGLLVKEVRNLESFNPLEDTIVFGRKPYRISVNRTIEFYLGGEQKIEKGEQELPEYLAVYLVAKGEGVPVE